MKQSSKLWGLAAVTAVVLLVGCGPSAHIEKDESANLKDYKTFAWVDMKEPQPGDKLMESKVKDAITNELENKLHWTESKRKPDVLLSYDVLVEKSVRKESQPVYSNPFTRTYFNPYRRRFYNVYYPSQLMGYDNYNVPGRDGTITVTVTDARSEKAVLQGWATEELDGKKMSSDEIDKVVKAIFKKFDMAVK
ncbi:MAG: DUF4136 domain-containing protein [Ferruginibacter sp.]